MEKNPAPVGRSFSLFIGFQHVSTIINHHQPSQVVQEFFHPQNCRISQVLFASAVLYVMNDLYMIIMIRGDFTNKILFFFMNEDMKKQGYHGIV
jgi:hypothetical protein